MKNLLTEWRQYTEALLDEARVDDVIERYPGHEAGIRYMSENDPAGNDKYLAWMAKQYSEKCYSPEYIIKVTKAFHENKQRLDQKDIYQYSHAEDVAEAIESLSKTRSQKRSEVHDNTIKQYEDDDWLVVVPLSPKSSCYYGKGTKWCTAGKNAEQHFTDYFENQQITLIYIHDKTAPPQDKHSKLALIYGDASNDLMQIFDAEDESHSYEYLYKIYDNDVAKDLYKISDIAFENTREIKQEILRKRKLKIAKNGKPYQKKALAKNENTSPEIFEILFAQDNKELNILIAANESAPVQILRKLYESGNTNMKNAVLMNRNVPPNILLKASEDIHRTEALTYITKNNDAPKEAIVNVYETIKTFDKDVAHPITDASLLMDIVSIKKNIVLHPNAPDDVKFEAFKNLFDSIIENGWGGPRTLNDDWWTQSMILNIIKNTNNKKIINYALDYIENNKEEANISRNLMDIFLNPSITDELLNKAMKVADTIKAINNNSAEFYIDVIKRRPKNDIMTPELVSKLDEELQNDQEQISELGMIFKNMRMHRNPSKLGIMTKVARHTSIKRLQNIILDSIVVGDPDLITTYNLERGMNERAIYNQFKENPNLHPEIEWKVNKITSDKINEAKKHFNKFKKLWN